MFEQLYLIALLSLLNYIIDYLYNIYLYHIYMQMYNYFYLKYIQNFDNYIIQYH